MTAFRINGAVGLEVESPEFAGATAAVVVVGDEEEFFVGADEDAVWTIDGGAVEDAMDGAIGIDPVDALDGGACCVFLFEIVALSVARIGEIDAAFGVDGQVVRRVEGFAVERFRDDGELAVGIGSRDDAVAGFGADDVSVVVDEESVRTFHGITEVGGAGGGGVGGDAVISDVEEASGFCDPSGAFAGVFGIEFFWGASGDGVRFVAEGVGALQFGGGAGSATGCGEDGDEGEQDFHGEGGRGGWWGTK